MSTTSIITTTFDVDTGSNTGRRARVWTAGVLAGVVASAATSLVAVLASVAGGEITVGGEPIPVSGFALLTMVGTLLGVAIAKVAQRTRRPRAVFVASTVVLTALSIVPDLIADTGWSGRVLLAATHVVAAAIIVPALARRLEA